MNEVAQYIIAQIKEHNYNADLQKIKMEASKKFNLDRVVKNSEVLRFAEDPQVKKILRKKPVRTLSGIAVVAVMTRPTECPHGRCTYCPRGEDAPQSYTGEEPAALRARQYNFDPYDQTTARLGQLKRIGHPIDKIELIVMGGTFPSECLDYQEYFVKRCLDAMNSFYEENRSVILEEAQKKNEKSKVRCIGITFETRPDWCKEPHISRMLDFGVTRVELGVQNIYDFIYRRVKRGHTVKDVVESTQLMKDSGLKINYHLMPGLPGSSIERDISAFKQIFTDERFKPDMVKFYPCLVIRGTELYEQWKRGEFEPYTTEDALEVITEVKKTMPKWVRTMRIQRDIPAKCIDAGVKRSNLGSLVYQELERQGAACRCIRCREAGLKQYREGIIPEDIELLVESYKASERKEYFLSFEDVEKDVLIGFLRLRIPYKPFREEINKKTCLIRELHIYGQMLSLGEKKDEWWQHKNLGKRLLKKAEEIGREEGMKRILVTSGVGVREYYRKFGYRGIGAYMGKKLQI
ncbi:MAG: tRNA uridine(34) 5-carboxymethylaminomethyl modification radical SAM/GNAT enzyme Elp3 [Euryarchaeota archaeon]|nr:tRNA uridine(34) 5-carboxymethylaminomethyl modification radical SAM/GNAT enzyme Elp3 [Euryarchaeota archaeon]